MTRHDKGGCCVSWCVHHCTTRNRQRGELTISTSPSLSAPGNGVIPVRRAQHIRVHIHQVHRWDKPLVEPLAFEDLAFEGTGGGLALEAPMEMRLLLRDPSACTRALSIG
jgi:hypothetical protein